MSNELEVALTDITGTLGEWLDRGFDYEVPTLVADLVYATYKAAAGELYRREGESNDEQ